MSQPMMAAGFVVALLDYAVSRGADRTDLLRAADLDGHLLSVSTAE